MADVVLNHIYKVYPNGVKAVSDFNIDIKDKEFIVFVGPSGCGKSTTLRMIAGIEDITAGDLFIGDNLVNDVQSKDRDIAMVFQNYALYPHMTVYDNIAFSLRNHHVPKEEINKRVLEAAKILGLEEYLERKPKAMSGGQRQRVALGRAIVRNPKVFLLDEPLSNLDAKLRAQMRSEITKLHKKLATTFIYVTHDQVEAMTMGTRIVVMKLGVVQQIDTPTNLYNYPTNKFVAGFIGTPQMNFFDVTLERKASNVIINFEDKQKMSVDYLNFIKCDSSYVDGETHLTLGIRPDNISFESEKQANNIRAIITNIENLGNETLLYCELADLVKTEEVESSHNIIVKTSPDNKREVGDEVFLAFKNEFIQLFDNETSEAVMPFNPKYSFAKISVKGKKMTLLNKTIALPGAFDGLENGEYACKIPSTSIVDGDDFALECFQCQKIQDGLYLVTLKVNDEEYLFTTSPVRVTRGSEVKFGIALEDVIFEEKAKIEPVNHVFSTVGRFTKVKEMGENKKKVVNFYANTAQGKYLLNDISVKRLYSIEGRKSVSIDYRLEFTPLIVEPGANNNKVAHEVLAVLDYGHTQYLKVKVNDDINYLDITSVYNKDLKDVDFVIDQAKHLSAYNISNDVKII